MSVAYASPNRSHHFLYAEGLEAEGLLSTFVQGYPRMKKAPLQVDAQHVMHKDLLQLLYLPFFRLFNEHSWTQKINLASKDSIDHGLKKAMQHAQVGLFYNGCGLAALRHWKGSNRLFVCEAVNSHLDYQSALLREECRMLGVDFQEPYEPERKKRLAEYEESDFILCPSSFVAQSFIHHGVSTDRLLINPFGIGSPPIKSDSKEMLMSPTSGKDSKFRILYVGSVNYRKGLRYLIEAFAALKIPHKELWIVGPRLEPDGLADLTIPEGVFFKGVLKGEQLHHAYQSATLFVQPSIEEGLSLVIGEALAFGLPVIATQNTGAEEIFANNECGFIVPIRDSKSLQERMEQFAEEPELLQSMSQTALEKSNSFRGWAASQHQLCELMRKIQEGIVHE